jgi:molecular chaperone DnaK
MNNQVVIGIDLGTTYSCAAIVERGRPRVISDTGGSYLIPSVVAMDGKGNRLVGQAAKRQILTNPKNSIFASKRLIGRPFFSDEVKRIKHYVKYQILPADEQEEVVVKLHDEVYSLSEVSALLLDYIRNVSQDRIGKEISKAVVTVPAYFNDSQRQAVRTAGEIAKLDIIRIINEPTAAALAYGFGKGLNQKIAIYDLGGGTFDISILELRNNVFEVKATGGNTCLGGVDFDNGLASWVFEHFLKDTGVDLSKDPISHQRVQDACEQAKIELSSRPSARINIPFITAGPNGPLNIDYTIQREEFEDLIKTLVDSTLSTCDKVLDDAKLKVDDIDAVLLVGGSTRIPMVAKRVADFFKKPPSKGVHPDEAVALGAAILADSIAGSRQQEVMLLDVLPITIGLKLGGDRVSPIFERNSPVPNQKQKIFTTSKDDQDTITLSILQGDSPNASECVPIGGFNFSGLRKAPKGQARIEVTFTMSPEGILSLTARDPDTGQEQKSTIKVQSSTTKSYHQNLIAPQKPVVASDSAQETVITRTVTREKKLKAEEPAKTEKPAPEPAKIGKTAPERDTKTEPTPEAKKSFLSQPRPAGAKPMPKPQKAPAKKGLLQKIISLFSSRSK